MGKLLVLSVISILLFAPGAPAQNGVSIMDRRVAADTETITVELRVGAERSAFKGGATVLLVPTITDGTNRWSLPAIIVQGRLAKIAADRQQWASGVMAHEPALYDGALWLRKEEVADYSATAPWQSWMEESDIIAEILTMGCGGHNVDELVVYSNIPSSVHTLAEQEPEIVSPVTLPHPTTAERIAQTRSYVLPYSEFEKLAPGQLFDDDRENSIMVYFHQGRYDLVPDHSDNRRALKDLISSIREIENSADSRVRAILIAGFASPEGSFTFNDRLAFDRAAATKRYIMDQCELPDNIISLYNGSEDWRGLRMLVEQSQMPSKQRVLDIIDTVPIWDHSRQRGRLGELMRLEGGRPYRYMFENFFPKLRNAAYIKVYYDIIETESYHNSVF